MSSKITTNEKPLVLRESNFLDGDLNYLLKLEESNSNQDSSFHEHDFGELCLLLSGTATYVVEHGKCVMTPYDFVIIPSHTLHKFEAHENKGPYRIYTLWCHSSFAKKLSSKKTDLTSEFAHSFVNRNLFFRDPELAVNVKNYFEKILELEKSEGFGSDLLVENTFREYLISLSRYLVEKRENIIVPTSNKTIAGLVKYVEEHLSEDLSLPKIANALGLDAFYLSHLFSKEIGVTIHRYIVDKRLSQSKIMIEENLDTKTIIQKIGFKDESHFIQSFKKLYGITPKKYRQMVYKRYHQ